MKKNAKGIGPGKKGSGKRLIYKAGGGRKALKTWRSISKSTRSTIKKNAKARPGKYSIRKTLKNIRVQRKSQGRKATTGTYDRIMRGDT